MRIKIIIKKAITSLLALAIMIGVLTQLPHNSVDAASGTWNGNTQNEGVWLRVDWSETNQNPKTNTSTVAATVYLVQKEQYALNLTPSKTVKIKIGTKTHATKTTESIHNSGGAITKLGSYEVNVTHDESGSLNVPISASFEIDTKLEDTYYKELTTSNIAVLDTLDRATPSIEVHVSEKTATSVTLVGSSNESCDNWAYSKDDGITWISFGTAGTQNTTTIDGLSPNTPYTFKIKARRTTNNVIGMSESLSFTTAPSEPKDLKLTPLSNGNVRLEWEPVSGATVYNIYRNDILLSNGHQESYYEYIGLSEDTDYTFSISATNSEGAQGATASLEYKIPSLEDDTILSNSANNEHKTIAKRSATPFVEPRTTTNLSSSGLSSEVPHRLSVEEDSYERPTLKWNPSEGVISYNVYLNGKLVAESITDCFYKYDYLESATVYELGVSAINSEGETALSTLEYITKPQVPVYLSIYEQTHSETTLRWFNQGGSYFSHYNIYRDEEKIGESTTNTFVDNIFSMSAPPRIHIYTVTAVDLSGFETAHSNTVISHELAAPEIIFGQRERGIYGTMLWVYCFDPDSGIDESSYKWAYGNHPTEYFETQGNPYDGQPLLITRNGYYTIYVKDMVGNEKAVSALVDDIFFQKAFGGFEHSETDFTVDAPGIPIEFTRFYDSTNTISGPMGKGWRLSFMGTLVVEDNYVSINLPQGNPLLFELKEGTYYARNSYAVLTKTSNTWILKDAYYTYTFDLKGALTKISERNGNTVSLEVNDLGYPTKITDSMDRSYTLTYTNNLLTRIEDPIGRTMTYLYTNGVLTSVKNFKGEVIHTYEVDEEGRITVVKDAYQTALFTQSYDSNHHIARQVIDKETFEFSYSLDAYGNQIVTQGEKTLVYDNQGNILKDEEGTQYTYDLNYGHLLTKTTSDNEITSYSYSEDDLTWQVAKDSEGRTIEEITVNRTFFAESRRVKIRVETTTTTEYPEGEAPIKTVSTVTTTYDDKGNPLTIQEKSEDSDITMSNTFGSQGKVLTSIDKTGTLTTFTYDVYGYPTKVVTKAQNEDPVETKYTYNAIGFTLTLETNRGVKNAFVYDALGNVLRSTSKDGQKETRITRSVYNSKGEKVHEIGSLEYEEAKDALSVNSHGIATQDAYGESSVGIQYSYNSNGHLNHTKVGAYQVEKNDNDTISKVSVGNTSLAKYTYTEDEKALLKAVEYSNGALLSYSYDDKGNRTEFKVNDVLQYSYTYDDENRITSKKKLVAPDFETTYTYLENGDIEVTLMGGDNVLHKVLLSEDGLIKKQGSEELWDGESSAYDFDEDGLETFSSNEIVILQKQTQKGKGDRKEKEVISTPSNSLLTKEYGYDAEGLITQYTNSFKEARFDAYQYTYDGYGNITQVILNDEVILHYTYDKGNQLIRVDDKKSNETQAYTYDTRGNILKKAFYPYTLDSLESKTPLDTKLYEYQNPDFPDQLTSYDGQTITYDALGNPLNYRGWDMKWVKGRQLERMTKDKETFEFQYDDEGIRIYSEISKEFSIIGGEFYTTVDGLITSELDLDGDGNPWIFQYDKDKSLVGFTHNGREYVYVKNVQEDVIGILDKDGNQVVTYTYDAWGKTTSITGSLASTLGKANPMRYRSYYLDTETGLYYLQSRYYDPEVGRFISADEPETLGVLTNLDFPLEVNNLYTYSLNNPVNYSDRNGYVVTPANVIGAVVAGIIGAVGGHYLGNWFADKLNIKGWKRWLFVKGVTLLVGAAAAAVGWFIGPYISKAWGTWKSRLTGVLRQSYKKIKPIRPHDMNNHINVVKHGWNKVLSKVTPSGIESLLHQGIRHGIWGIDEKGVIKIVWRHKGKIIEITGKIIKGVFNISNGWVK